MCNFHHADWSPTGVGGDNCVVKSVCFTVTMELFFIFFISKNSKACAQSLSSCQISYFSKCHVICLQDCVIRMSLDSSKSVALSNSEL